MDAQRWRKLSELFDEALDLPEPERARFLDGRCAQDRELRAELESMLADATEASFLDPPEWLDAARRLPAEAGEADRETLFEAPPPARFGGYRILREIGRGGMGIVYEAVQEPLGRRVALKILPDSRLGNPTDLARFRRESETASRLEHPNICAVYDAGIAQGRPFLAMRYVEGQTLAAALSSAREEEGREDSRVLHDTLALVETLARALHAAHEAGVVHRDVKPGNVMISKAGEPLLLDFGLALDIESGSDLTRTGQVPGTPSYMAPEQISGRREECDRQTDVYALGAVLYECLTLAPPFEAPTLQALCHSILTREPEDPRRKNPAVTRDLAAVVSAALEKDRGRRYRTALALAEDLCALREGRAISVRPIRALGRLARWARREPAAATAAVLGLLLVVGGPTGYALQAHRAKRRLQGEQARTRQQSLRADANYQRARKAVDEITFDFARRELADPTFAIARDRLFELGLRYYRSFVTENEGEPRVAFDVAAAQVGVGRLSHELGRDVDACKTLEDALNRLDAVAGALTDPEGPDSLAVAEQRSTALFWLARAQRALGEIEAATISLERARDVHESARPVGGKQAAQATWSQRQARIEGELSKLLFESEREQEARAQGERSLARLQKSTPTADPEFLRTYVTRLRDESFQRKLAGEYEEAVALLTEGLERVNQEASESMAGLYRAELLSRRGQVLTAAGRLAEAEQDLRTAAEGIEAALDGEHAHDLALLEELGFVYAELGSGYDLRGDGSEALRAHRRALEIRREFAQRVPDAPTAKILLAKTLAAVAAFTEPRDQAREAWEEAIHIGSQVVEVHPGQSAFAGTLNTLRTYYAQHLLAWDEPKLAFELLADAVAFRRGEIERGRKGPLDHYYLGIALHRQAAALRAIGGGEGEVRSLVEEGLAAAEAALELAPNDAFTSELMDAFVALEAQLGLGPAR